MEPAPYIPARRDVVWLDFEPSKGREIGKYRPALVLSNQAYNRKTGLLICCPISASIRGVATEVPISNLEKPFVVTAGLAQTLSWNRRPPGASQGGITAHLLQPLFPPASLPTEFDMTEPDSISVLQRRTVYVFVTCNG